MKFLIVLQTTILLLFSAVHITSAAAVESLEDTGPGKSAVMPVPQDSYGQVQPLKIEPTSIRKVTVTAEGCAKIYGGKVEHARLAALRMAYAEAVQSTVGIEIRNLSITKNVKQVSDIVLARSKGFIRTYKLVRLPEARASLIGCLAYDLLRRGQRTLIYMERRGNILRLKSWWHQVTSFEGGSYAM